MAGDVERVKPISRGSPPAINQAKLRPYKPRTRHGPTAQSAHTQKKTKDCAKAKTKQKQTNTRPDIVKTKDSAPINQRFKGRHRVKKIITFSGYKVLFN